MKRVAIVMTLVVAVLALSMIGAGGAIAWNGPSQRCIAHIEAQAERGVVGHGSKEGDPGPSNCDHAFGGPVD